MLNRFYCALCLCLLTLPAMAQSDTEVADTAMQEKVLVVGQRPGPGLWKVTRGDHVLWIFGAYSPLPKKMEWRSHEVAAILAQTQEFLEQPSAQAKVGFFRQLTLLPYAIGITNNPDGARLKDVLPADVHARWLLLKAKYIGADEGIEKTRPFFAAAELYSKALSKSGMSNSDEVLKTIDKIVKDKQIKVTSSTVALAMDDPVKAIKDFKKGAMDDVACFSKTLDRLEADLDTMRARANAWAKGDVAAIRTVGFAEREDACREAMMSSAFVKGQPGFQSMRERIMGKWMASAEQALAANTTSFAVLQIKDILDPKGLVAALEAKGYAVVAPD